MCSARFLQYLLQDFWKKICKNAAMSASLVNHHMENACSRTPQRKSDKMHDALGCLAAASQCGCVPTSYKNKSVHFVICLKCETQCQ